MQKETVVAVEGRMNTPEFDRIKRTIGEHLLRLMTMHAADGVNRVGYLANGEELDDCMHLLGVDSLQGRVLSVYYENWMSGKEYHGENPSVGADMNVEHLLQAIEERHSGFSDDFPNDFIAGVVIELDETSAVAIRYKSEECPIICEDCRRGGDVIPSDGYSCEHHSGDYNYIIDYEFMFCTKENAKGINWDFALDDQPPQSDQPD